MARPARFTADGILDAAAQVALERWRDATVADVAERLGTPAGTIYYRFPSRDDLFGALWLRAVERFHVGIRAAAALPDAHEAALAMAVHIPRFCRDHPLDAVAMTLYRQPDLLQRVDDDLRDAVARANDDIAVLVADLAERVFGVSDEHHRLLLAIACQESPYGLVRRYLRTEEPIPAWLDDVVLASSGAILGLGGGCPEGR